MTTPDTEHPPEDILIAYALGENGKDAAAHVASCARCRAFVEEMRQLRASVAGFDGEEPPGHLRQRVLRAARPAPLAGLARGLPGAPAATMFIVNLATVLFLVFVYLLVILLV